MTAIVTVAPAVISATGLQMLNGAGGISAPGLKVGDRLLVTFMTRPANGINFDQPGDALEIIVSVADEIQQIATGNLSDAIVDVFLVRLP